MLYGKSPYLFGFRKAHSTEQCLNTMLENWKTSLDCKKQVGAVLTDLSKALFCSGLKGRRPFWLLNPPV